MARRPLDRRRLGRPRHVAADAAVAAAVGLVLPLADGVEQRHHCPLAGASSVCARNKKRKARD